MITEAELHTELSEGEKFLFKALEQEFGCAIRRPASTPIGNGWLNLDAAVVRDETLVAILVYENRGNGIPEFQVKFVADLLVRERLQYFGSVEVVVAVISSGNRESDDLVRQSIDRMAAESQVPMRLVLHRLHKLRTRFGQ